MDKDFTLELQAVAGNSVACLLWLARNVIAFRRSREESEQAHPLKEFEA